jgi:hypothetical protein
MGGKNGITLGLSVMSKDGKLFLRKAHNAGNRHNLERQSCMRSKLTGQRGGGRSAQQARFRAASAQCR